jgi:membrane protease YdiL (CAAX protease family)
VNEGSDEPAAKPKAIWHRLWCRIPVLVRAAIVALFILNLGQVPPGLFLIVGLRFSPAVPWFLVATAIWLAIFWQYLGGRWWPASSAAVRRQDLRGAPLPFRVWFWSLCAGGLGMVCVLSSALLTGLVADLPDEARKAPFDLAGFPWWTQAAFFLSIAAVAGIVEEAAFRGYMLSMIERRHGWVIGIASVAILFYVVHLSHAYATLAFAPFFLAYSLLHGVLVFLTRSILPSVVLHAMGDFTILPIQYGILAGPFGSSVSVHALVVASTLLAAGVAMRKLAIVTRARRVAA